MAGWLLLFYHLVWARSLILYLSYSIRKTQECQSTTLGRRIASGIIGAIYNIAWTCLKGLKWWYTIPCVILEQMESQVEQQSRELPERIVLASLKPPQHWPFLLWKCAAGCSRPAATCCLVEWPRRPPSAACLFPEDCFYCLCCSVNAFLWHIVQHKWHNLFPLIHYLYFGSILLRCVVGLGGNGLWTPNNLCFLCALDVNQLFSSDPWVLESLLFSHS